MGDHYVEQGAHSRPNLTITTGAEAKRVLFDDAGACVGVEWSAGGATVTATVTREVVLCAGSYMSPQLLLASGVGPKAELEAAGITCRVDSPHVGKHLKDHL